MKPELLVLAAGMGTRYGGMKQIDPVGPSGELIIDYSLFDAARAGFGKVIFVIQADLEGAFREHFSGTTKLQIEYVHQTLTDLPETCTLPAGRHKPWGTAHAVWSARKVITEPFAVINADDFYGATSYQALANFLTTEREVLTGKLLSLVAFQLGNTLSRHGSVARGVCAVDQHSFLQSVTERHNIEAVPDSAVRYQDEGGAWQALTGKERVSMNMWGLAPAIFNLIEKRLTQFIAERSQELEAELYLPSVVNDLVTDGICKVLALTTDEKWFGMTYSEDRTDVADSIKRLIREGRYPQALW
ncbi:sugar phosphate nucleotidyltransferase [Oligoflexia bacterium]|nr:sugar phosphate nucleotidyltransferase [Oligoflexia bacterium]